MLDHRGLGLGSRHKKTGREAGWLRLKLGSIPHPPLQVQKECITQHKAYGKTSLSTIQETVYTTLSYVQWDLGTAATLFTGGTQESPFLGTARYSQCIRGDRG